MKALNIFGIILAWILSIAMVLMLIAAPLTLSALSLLDPENIAELVGEALVKPDESAAAVPEQDYGVVMLSAENGVREENSLTLDPIGENAETDDALAVLKDSLQDIVGEELNKEVLNKVLRSDAVSELLSAYVGDVTNAIIGKPGEKQFTAEKLVEVVKNNAGEIVEVLQEAGVTLTDDQKAQLKTEIKSAVEENAESIIAEIPTPEEIKESLVDGNQEIEIAFEILRAKNQIKGMLVGVIVVISLLIFGLRYPGFRGLRWLSTNLFTAGGFNVVLCIVLGLGSSAVKGVAEGVKAIESTPVEGIVTALLSQLTTGVIIRTVIIFVAAIALLVGYILLKVFVRKKKADKQAEPVSAEPIPAPAFVPESPVYTAVTVEPEIAAEQPAEEPAPTEEP